MNTFILLVLLFGAGSPDLYTQEFDTQEACIQASIWVVNEQSTNISVTCLPKGDVGATQYFDLAAFEKDLDAVLAGVVESTNHALVVKSIAKTNKQLGEYP